MAIAQLCNPAETVFDNSGNLIIADYGNRRVTPDGTISTIAGNGNKPPALNAGPNGDGGPAIHATFDNMGGMAFDSAGNVYVSESLGNAVRKITPKGEVSTLAGTGRRGYSGDGGPALEANLFNPGPLSVGPDGALYVFAATAEFARSPRMDVSPWWRAPEPERGSFVPRETADRP